ncbi:hypothetical protein APICC_01374 [Apis cerana cerana]|uniref:SHSP domain-containing protein n=1 Tax=Apis cerana cerana TaxID=94128 RepID=A0A2A3E3Q5_APICC|nr:hypothetical protein APICC_01374 [Apis cerana cerana]
MSLIPMMFSDWWEDLDRPHRLWDQHFGTAIDLDDFNDLDSLGSEVLLYRPHKRGRRHHRHNHHPFLKAFNKRHGRGTSTVQADKDKFQVTLDVSQFAPEEITVKVVDQKVVIEAKHEEKRDEHGWVSRQFIRKYIIPSQCDINQVESHLSSDGILSITAPRKEPLQSRSNERTVKVHYTGEPALTNFDDSSNDVSESQKEQQIPQREQSQSQQQNQQLQNQQHQQHQRCKKGSKGV